MGSRELALVHVSVSLCACYLISRALQGAGEGRMYRDGAHPESGQTILFQKAVSASSLARYVKVAGFRVLLREVSKVAL